MKIINLKIFYYEINPDENFPDYGIAKMLQNGRITYFSIFS